MEENKVTSDGVSSSMLPIQTNNKSGLDHSTSTITASPMLETKYRESNQNSDIKIVT